MVFLEGQPLPRGVLYVSLGTKRGLEEGRGTCDNVHERESHMEVTRRQKIYLILAPIALLLLFIAWKGARYWWYHAYSRGTRTGIIRKVSIKGPPYCKYLSGEMALQGTLPGQATEMFEFSVDDDSENSPLVKLLHDAEKKGERVTLSYRQDLHSLYRCTPSEYFVTGLEK